MLPWGVRLATPLIDAAAGHLSLPALACALALAALVLLTLPAAAMGAGFPLLVEGWKRYRRDIGAAYGSNTLGAAAGALLPLLLLPTMGWSLAIRAVALLGLIGAAGLVVLEPLCGPAARNPRARRRANPSPR